MLISDVWLRDLPQQFQGKEKIEILIRAFSKQLEELEAVFREINTETDIKTAVGANLDRVGDIVCLTRKEAGEISRERFNEPVLSDERYRPYLYYKVLKNTSDCTYEDIMKAIEILWDVKKASYYERKDRPATIFIGLPTVDIEDVDQAEGKPDILKAGGVGFIYTAKYGTKFDLSCMERVVFSNLKMNMAFDFWGMKLLNGTWLLDGSVLLNQKMRYGLKVLLEMLFQVHETAEKIRALPVIVKKDLWYLDGKYLLDGTRLLDAEIRKEEL